MTNKATVQKEIISVADFHSVQEITPETVESFIAEATKPLGEGKEGVMGLAEAVLGKERLEEAKAKAEKDRDEEIKRLRLAKTMIHCQKKNYWLVADDYATVRHILKDAGVLFHA